MRWLAPLLLCSGCALAIGLDDYRSGGEGGATVAASSGQTQANSGGQGQAGEDPQSSASQSATSGSGGGALKALGEACGVPLECESGFCVDSVCCDSSCDAACAKCNSAGACVPEAANATCGAYHCNGIDMTCPTSCGESSDCASNYWCDVGGTYACVPNNSGAFCNSDVDCSFGDCDGGVCCNSISSPCNGVCRSCNSSHTGFSNGTCAIISSGDPEGDCGAQCQGCECLNGMCASPT